MALDVHFPPYKTGTAGDDAPSALCRSVIAFDDKTCFVAEEAFAKKTMQIRRPVQRGLVVNWDEMYF